MTLLDLTIESLLITRERLKSEGFSANYVCGDAENLPLADNQFDVVYSYGVIHHSPDTAKSVREILRVLKKGGQAVVLLHLEMREARHVLQPGQIGEVLREMDVHAFRSGQVLQRTQVVDVGIDHRSGLAGLAAPDLVR